MVSISGSTGSISSPLTQSRLTPGAGPRAADVQMSFPIEAADARVGFAGRLPKLKGFVERIQARPAYKRALERGGPQTFLK